VGWEDSQFPEFFASQYGPLRRLGFLLTGDWSDGEELAQDALVRVWWRWALVRRQQHPEAYARKVLINRHRPRLGPGAGCGWMPAMPARPGSRPPTPASVRTC
jgi:Sigma-70 region 2